MTATSYPGQIGPVQINYHEKCPAGWRVNNNFHLSVTVQFNLARQNVTSPPAIHPSFIVGIPDPSASTGSAGYVKPVPMAS